MRSEAAGVLGVTNLSSLAELRPGDATLCAASEFLARDAGLPGMEKAYDFEYPNDNIVRTQEGQIYRAVEEGDECNFSEAFVTDGRVRAFDLEILEDDKQFSPVTIRLSPFGRRSRTSTPVSRTSSPPSLRSWTTRPYGN